MVLSGRLAVPRRNNDEPLLRSCCGITIITVKLKRARSNIPTTTFNPCKCTGTHPASPCYFFPWLWSWIIVGARDVKAEMAQAVFKGGKRSGGGGQGKGGGGVCGKKGEGRETGGTFRHVRTRSGKGPSGVQSEELPVLPPQHLEWWADKNKWKIKTRAD